MKLMTWNIRLGKQNGLEPLRRVLRDEAPDVVALQEVGRRWVMGPPGDTTRELQGTAGLDYAFFVPSLAWYPPAQYGHALLCNRPLIAPSIQMLPRITDEQRTYLEARIETPTGPVTLVTTHLSYIADRPPQGAVLVERLKELDDAGHRFVLMGDLNEDDLSERWMAELSGFAHAAPADEPTYPADEPRARIDWIWSNFGDWKSARVVDTGNASDHLAVVAELA